MLKFSRDFKKALKEAKVTEKQFIEYCDDNMVELSRLTTEDGCYEILNELENRKARLANQMYKLDNLFKSFNPNSENFKSL